MIDFSIIPFSENERQAYDEGKGAFRIGSRPNMNPYNSDKEKLEWYSWLDGWADALYEAAFAKKSQPKA